MGVVLTTAIVFAVAAALVELRVVLKTPFLARLVERFTVAGIAISVLLSLALGAVFGAGGMIVMFAAIMATILTQPIYMMLAKVKQTGHDIGQTVEQVKDVFRPFKNLFMLAFAIMAIPFKVLFGLVKFIDRHTSPKRSAA